jgi:hypothetical protein
MCVGVGAGKGLEPVSNRPCVCVCVCVCVCRQGVRACAWLVKA